MGGGSPGSYGRLVGMLKSAVFAGDAHDAAAYARAAVDTEGESSPTAAYALAIAALVLGDDGEAARHAATMASGPSEAFGRTADAIIAIARGDAAAYTRALDAIVRDFEARSDHLTGVAVADTAALLEIFAGRRGLIGGVQSELLPPMPSSAELA